MNESINQPGWLEITTVNKDTVKNHNELELKCT